MRLLYYEDLKPCMSKLPTVLDLVKLIFSFWWRLDCGIWRAEPGYEARWKPYPTFGLEEREMSKDRERDISTSFQWILPGWDGWVTSYDRDMAI